MRQAPYKLHREGERLRTPSREEHFHSWLIRSVLGTGISPLRYDQIFPALGIYLRWCWGGGDLVKESYR